MRPQANTLSALMILIATGAASAQTPLPINRNPALYPTDDALSRKHMGPTGKPCITVFGDAQAQKMNPLIYNHMIMATNACGLIIKLKICYYHSDQCVDLALPAYSQKEAMLGIMPRMTGFRFEYREQFTALGPN
jgi:hypothetical protein